MVMKYVIVGILALQKPAVFHHSVEMMMMAVVGWWVNSQRACWQREQYGVFLECTLLGSYLDDNFWKQ
jgi:hypothetical protein